MRRSVLLLAALLGGLCWTGCGTASGAASSSTVTFTSAELKTGGTTPTFKMSGPWTMQWHYGSCATSPTATFLVAVNQPSGDPYTDTGPDEAGASGSGTDSYFDSGTFSLTIASGCTWTITVAPASGGASATPLTLSSKTVGESGSTASFVVAGKWTLLYGYTCAGTATTAAFAVRIQSATGEPNTLTGPSATTPSGTGRTAYAAGGAYNFIVSSVCTWTLRVEATAAYTRVDGATADATAADAFEHQFNASAGACPGSTGTRPVVLATDATYPDALASAYLARSLRTGLLLTPPAKLSAPAAAAIAKEGITRVDVVGGPLAVSTAVVSKLEATSVSACGGSPASRAAHISVTRIAGSSEYTTAEKIAETPPAAQIGAASLGAAYSGTNASGGTGRYNQTPGAGSAAPSSSTPLPTAIVATGKGFQDAEAASTLAYAARLPMLLTTPSSLSAQAASAIKSLGVEQVLVVGGPLAVSDAVVRSLEGLGVTVLRVAGDDDTATAVEIADLETAAAPAGFGWAGTGTVTVARGDFYADGLAGAVLAADGPGAQSPSPMLLTVSPSTVGPALTAFLKSAGSSGLGGKKVTHLTVLGGTYAVSPGALDAMVEDL